MLENYACMDHFKTSSMNSLSCLISDSNILSDGSCKISYDAYEKYGWLNLNCPGFIHEKKDFSTLSTSWGQHGIVHQECVESVLTRILCCLLFSCVATWVGGAFIVGIVEMVYTPSMGLIRTLVLLTAYSSSFIIGETKACVALSFSSSYKPVLTVCWFSFCQEDTK